MRLSSIFTFKTPRELRPLNREDTDKCTQTITCKYIVCQGRALHITARQT